MSDADVVAGGPPPVLYVVGFLFSPDARRVVLVRKRKPAWQKGRLNGVGGKVERGETALQAMEREFHEETGLAVPAERWLHKVTLHWGGPYAGVLDVFAAFDERIDQVRTVEAEKIGIYRTRPLPRSVINNLHWLVPFCLDNLAGPVVIEDQGGSESGAINHLERLRLTA